MFRKVAKSNTVHLRWRHPAATARYVPVAVAVAASASRFWLLRYASRDNDSCLWRHTHLTSSLAEGKWSDYESSRPSLCWRKRRTSCTHLLYVIRPKHVRSH